MLARRSVFFLFALLLGALIPLASRVEAAPPTTGTLRGLVAMEGSDLVFAQVILKNASGVQVGSTFSGAGGYIFGNLAPGSYTVTALGPYGDDSAGVTLVAGQTTYQDLTLPGPPDDPIAAR